MDIFYARLVWFYLGLIFACAFGSQLTAGQRQTNVGKPVDKASPAAAQARTPNASSKTIFTTKGD